ncbi:MAG: hypothetical protein GY938_29450 [Ketobacter sp.]|nr:hypothetical protein [Ketobacter sp.]
MKSVGALAHKHATNHHGKVGAAVLHAVGHVANSKAKDKRKAFATYLVAQLKKHHYPTRTKQEIHAIIDKVKHKMVHAKDVFGKNFKQHGQALIGSLEGRGILSSIGKFAKKGYKAAKKGRDKAFHKLKDFANGKTKFKPSQLANYAAAAIGAAGTASAFIPGVDLISVPTATAVALGLKSASLALKTSGRGKGKGLKVAGQGGSLEARGGALIHMPQSIKKYIKKHPQVARAIAGKASARKRLKRGGEFTGTGAAGRFGAAMGIAGTSAAAGAYGMYRYMLNNPSVAAKVAAKGFGSVFSNFLGSGVGSGCKGSGKGGCKGSGEGGWWSGSEFKQYAHTESKTDMLRRSCKRRGNHEGLCRTLNPKGSGQYAHTESKTDMLRRSCKLRGSHEGLCRRVNPKGSGVGGCKGKGLALPGGFKGGAFSPDMIVNLTKGHTFSKAGALGAFLGLSGVALKKAWRYYQKNKKKKGSGVGGCRCKRGKGLALPGGAQFSAVSNSYDGGGLPYGVSRTPSGKIKKDRYGVYYGYYNKTGGGLTRDAFILKGKKVISKRRQEMGRKNMNFRRS